MAKIKRIVEIDEEDYNTIMCEPDSPVLGWYEIAHSAPYSSSGDLISREAMNIIDNAPTVDVTCPFCNARQGEWIIDKEHTKNPLLWYKCSLCGVYHSPTNFCPNCGADMRKDGKE